ncbi:MAG: hypothetical protein HQL01_05665 [Nitrospirae bacterium]|nr:hypothetical protein [Nitrospirota bacterium]
MRVKVTIIAFCLLACMSLIPLFYTYREISDNKTIMNRASYTIIEPQNPPNPPDKPKPINDNRNDESEPISPFDETEPALEPDGFPPDDISSDEKGGGSTNE